MNPTACPISITLDITGVPGEPEHVIPQCQIQAEFHLKAWALKRRLGECQHPQWPRSQWVQAVTENRTNLGYWQWVLHQIEHQPDYIVPRP